MYFKFMTWHRKSNLIVSHHDSQESNTLAWLFPKLYWPRYKQRNCGEPKNDEEENIAQNPLNRNNAFLTEV